MKVSYCLVMSMHQPLCRFEDWKIFSDFFFLITHLEYGLHYLQNISIFVLFSLIYILSSYVRVYMCLNICVCSPLFCCLITVSTFLEEKNTYDRVRLQLNTKRGVASRIQEFILFSSIKLSLVVFIKLETFFTAPFLWTIAGIYM